MATSTILKRAFAPPSSQLSRSFRSTSRSIYYVTSPPHRITQSCYPATQLQRPSQTTTLSSRHFTTTSILQDNDTFQSQQQKEQESEMSDPTGLIATEGIELLTLGTPNGYKASIILEELKEAYGDKFPKITYQTINIMKNIQKEPW